MPTSVENFNSEMERTKASAKLTPNQKAILAALAEGLTVAEVAVDWEVSQTVVYRNIEQARAKLGGHTTTHAIAIWVRMQLTHSGGANGHGVIAVNDAPQARQGELPMSATALKRNGTNVEGG